MRIDYTTNHDESLADVDWDVWRPNGVRIDKEKRHQRTKDRERARVGHRRLIPMHQKARSFHAPFWLSLLCCLVAHVP